MSFDPKIMFDTDTSDEELERQLHSYINGGGTGPGLVNYIVHCQGAGVAEHITRLMTILSEKVLPATLNTLPDDVRKAITPK